MWALDLLNDFINTHVSAFAQKLFALQEYQYGRYSKDAKMRSYVGSRFDIDRFNLKRIEVCHDGVKQFWLEGVTDVAFRC